MTNIEELSVYLVASQMRFNVMKSLISKPLRPSEIARITKYHTNNVSMILNQLEKKKLVVCLTPEKKAWRYYKITDLGKQAFNESKKIK